MNNGNWWEVTACMGWDNIHSWAAAGGVFDWITALRIFAGQWWIFSFPLMAQAFWRSACVHKLSQCFSGSGQRINQRLWRKWCPQKSVSLFPFGWWYTHQGKHQRHHMFCRKSCNWWWNPWHDSQSVEELQKLSMKELYSVLERYDPSAPVGCLSGRQMKRSTITATKPILFITISCSLWMDTYNLWKRKSRRKRIRRLTYVSVT